MSAFIQVAKFRKGTKALSSKGTAEAIDVDMVLRLRLSCVGSLGHCDSSWDNPMTENWCEVHQGALFYSHRNSQDTAQQMWSYTVLVVIFISNSGVHWDISRIWSVISCWQDVLCNFSRINMALTEYCLQPFFCAETRSDCPSYINEWTLCLLAVIGARGTTQASFSVVSTSLPDISYILQLAFSGWCAADGESRK